MRFLSHRARAFAAIRLAVTTLAACESSSAPPEAKGVINTSFIIPTNATSGTRVRRAYGAFDDRTDPDKITIR